MMSSSEAPFARMIVLSQRSRIGTPSLSSRTIHNMEDGRPFVGNTSLKLRDIVHLALID